jgi:hypothetical protein
VRGSDKFQLRLPRGDKIKMFNFNEGGVLTLERKRRDAACVLVAS